nr:hypothetical protein BaRGS_033628 [Batillaria attramentaria]KAG5693328.1 hypothetical protein BaRGS_017621 [Batillaria attramentaria]
MTPCHQLLAMEELRKSFAKMAAQQAGGEYQLVVYAEWSSGSGSRGSAYYDNLNIGTEDTKFELSYDSFRADVDKPIDNGFPTTSGPIKFYTNDMDFMCTMSSGGAGWFVSSCTSKGKIFTATMQWPVSGVTQQLDLVQLSLTRTLAIADP